MNDAVQIYKEWLKEEDMELPQKGLVDMPILRLIKKARQIGFDDGVQFARDNPNYEGRP